MSTRSTNDPGDPRTHPSSEPPDATGGPRGRLKRWWADPTARRRLIWGGIGVAILLLLVLAFQPDPLPVQTAEVTEGRLELTIDAEGMTRVVDRYQIAAPTAGRLERPSVEEGDAVPAGAIVARLTPVPLDPQAIAQAEAGVAAARARVSEASAGMEQAREAMEVARRHAERVATIVEAGGLSREAGEQARLDAIAAEQQFAASEARVNASSSDLDAARAALVNIDPEEGGGGAVVDVTAPAAGRVLRVDEQSERVVPAGTPLIDIGDASGLEVVVDVLSTDAVQVQLGAPLRILDWGGGSTLLGQVRLIEPSAFTEVSALGVEEQRVNVIGDLFDPPPELGDRYRVDARIVVQAVEEAVKVPSSALFQVGEEWAVFVVEGGTAVQRQLEIGLRGTSEAQVVAGLEPAETVVVFPSDQLQDGASVRQEE
jgi:HlyD family secretion protein